MQEEASAHKASHLSAALRAPRALTPLVLFMGFLGATLRYLLELALPSQGGVSYATLIVNVFGCFTARDYQPITLDEGFTFQGP